MAAWSIVHIALLTLVLDRGCKPLRTSLQKHNIRPDVCQRGVNGFDVKLAIALQANNE
jgi:hypothetical protein